MPSLITELCECLEDNAACVDRLITLSGEKKTAVIKNDLEALRDILARENEAAGRAQRMEKRRESLFGDIAIVINRPTDGLTLGGLCESVRGQPEHMRLQAVYEKLKAAMEELRAANEESRALIRNALDYIDFSVNVLRTTFVDEQQDYQDSRKGIDIRN